MGSATIITTDVTQKFLFYRFCELKPEYFDELSSRKRFLRRAEWYLRYISEQNFIDLLKATILNIKKP
jgi:hypothetical protein